MTKTSIYFLLILLCTLSVSCSKDDENPVVSVGDTFTLTIDGNKTKLYLYEAEYRPLSDDFLVGLSDTPPDADDSNIDIAAWGVSLLDNEPIGEDFRIYKDSQYSFSSGSVVISHIDMTSNTLTLAFDGVWEADGNKWVTVKGTVPLKYTTSSKK